VGGLTVSDLANEVAVFLDKANQGESKLENYGFNKFFTKVKGKKDHRRRRRRMF